VCVCRKLVKAGILKLGLDPVVDRKVWLFTDLIIIAEIIDGLHFKQEKVVENLLMTPLELADDLTNGSKLYSDHFFLLP
jgi:hypothetical protein